ncbi:MAG: BamA/TamA family outer membrane protein [Ferruginibacter sp.]
MNKNIIYAPLFMLMFLSACSVRKYLPAGEQLYKGATINVKREVGVRTSKHTIKKELQVAAKPTPNKFLLGQPYKVWFWYKIGEPKKEKGLKAWLRKKVGEPPVLSSRVDASVTAEDMQSLLENEGYFHSIVKGDTVDKSYLTTAIYNATVFLQYKIKSIKWVNDSSKLLNMLDSISSAKKSLLKVGDPYNLKNIQEERSRLDLKLKTNGYYFFNPDYIMAYADSTIGNHEVNLFLNIKKITPEKAKHAYTINRIVIFPNYTLLFPPPDTSRTGLFNYDGLLIRDTVHKYKPELFKNSITYRPGQLYSSKQQNTSLNRLINLGTFKFVKNQFNAVQDSGDPYRLNAYYYITPSKDKSIQAEIDGFTEETRYVGSQASINWKNRNTFGGGELLSIKAYGGLALTFADSLKGDNNFRLGGDASITFPKYVIPFFKVKENNFYPPRTNFSLGYELFIKENFYTQNIFRLQYEFSWKESNNKEHTFAPIAITYLNARNITDSFYAAAQIDPSILLNVYSEAILGTYYSYLVHNANPKAPNQFFFKGGIELSGNIAGLISNAKTPRQKQIFGTPFAEYTKLDAEIIYSRLLSDKSSWANHFQIGIGIPYGNSSMLPFSKQYIIGGGSSIRGFPVYSLGPGSYLPTANDIKYFQTIGGDFKLLFNTELRFPLVGKWAGAIFVDAGNIWTKDTLLFGPTAQLTKDFYKQIAVASGFGIRLNLDVLLLRLDLGIPLRKPYLPDGQRWVINQIDFGDGTWRANNLVLNLGIGYPF